MNRKQKNWYNLGEARQAARNNAPIQVIQEVWGTHSKDKYLFEFLPLFEFFQKGARDQYKKQQKQS